MTDSGHDSLRREFLRWGVSGTLVGIAGCSEIRNTESSPDEEESDEGGGGSDGESAPEIVSAFNVSSPSNRQIRVTFESSRQLESIAVEISGPESTTLSRDDFGYTVNEGGYRFEATYEVESDGEYTATLSEVVDTVGNSGATDIEAAIRIEGQDPQPIRIGPREEPNPSRHEIPSLPEADWIVANDGSGDYDTIAKAMEVMKDGDVIKLKSGEYTVPGSGFGALIGAGKENTTITIDADEIGNGFRVFNAAVTGGSTIVDALVKFYNCNISVAVRSYPDVVPSAMIDGINSTFNERIEASSLDAKGCEFSGVRFRQGGDLDKKAVCELTDCIFHGEFEMESASGTVKRCEFSKTPSMAGLKSIDTVFSNGVEGGQRFENCLFRPGVEYAGDAVAIASGAGLLKHSIIKGKVSGKIPDISDSRINNIIGNIFDPDTEDVVVITNVTGENYGSQLAKTLEYNAFVGCTLNILSISRFQGGVERMSADHNYYHNFDGSDEDGDGIMDKPYPLPGNADVVDRNPLANKNIKKYLEEKNNKE